MCLPIESSLLRMSLTRTSATCMPSTHQMEAVVVGNFYINSLAQMGTGYSTPAVSLLDIATESHEEFVEKTFVSGCKVCGYLPWKHPSAFQLLQFCSSPSYKQKRFMWPCSKLFWLCLSCKQLLVSTITAKLMSKFVFVPPPNNRLLSLDCILSKVGIVHNYT